MKTLLLGIAMAAAAAAPGIDALDPNLGVTFPAEHANALTGQCGPRHVPQPSGVTWLPEAEQIEVLEAELAPLLARKLRERGLHGPRWSVAKYHRQYGGLMIGDRLVIYVNGFHSQVVEHRKPPVAWKRSVVGICDGGEKAIGVEYDPQWGTFENFHFNGALERRP